METAMDAATRDRLAKVMAMTTSNHDAEALAAVRRANGILAKHQLRWPDVLANAKASTQEKAQPGAGQWSNWSQTKQSQEENPSWTMSGGEEAFAHDVCDRGLGTTGQIVLRAKDTAFLRGMKQRLKDYAYNVMTSKRQYDWLMDIDQRLMGRGL